LSREVDAGFANPAPDRPLRRSATARFASGNFTQDISDTDRDKHRGNRIFPDELDELILSITRRVDFSLNCLANIRHGTLWTVTHALSFHFDCCPLVHFQPA
jgi:hypothetical protein